MSRELLRAHSLQTFHVIGYICAKNATASTNSAVFSRTATRSNPNRCRTRLLDRTLYSEGSRSAAKLWPSAITTIKSTSLGFGSAVTKLPSTMTWRTNSDAAASFAVERSRECPLDHTGRLACARRNRATGLGGKLSPLRRRMWRKAKRKLPCPSGSQRNATPRNLKGRPGWIVGNVGPKLAGLPDIIWLISTAL